MRYLTYNNGTLVRLHATGQAVDPLTTPDLWAAYQSWLIAGNTPFNADLAGPPMPTGYMLAASDMRMARIGEDIMNILVAKGIIAITDLPPVVQQIITERQQWRAGLSQD